MVDRQIIIRSNASLRSVDAQIALFVGATSGIGLGILKEFVKNSQNPRVYIVARSSVTAAPTVDDLRSLNPSGQFEIIERNVSLLKDAEQVAEHLKTRESKIDLLCLTVGFFSLDGRQATTEGLDASMTTRYYSRIRITQLLIPLLNASRSPHVLSINAGGKEGPVHEEDLALDNPHNYSVGSSATHCATMMTLALEHLASENPRISFVHSYPGIVDTPLLYRMKGGAWGSILRCTITPIFRLFIKSILEAGQMGLYLLTSARYSVDDYLVPLADGVMKLERSKGGIFIVHSNGESAAKEEILERLRESGLEKKVWDHTIKVFEHIPWSP